MWRKHSSVEQLAMLSQGFSPAVLIQRKKYTIQLKLTIMKIAFWCSTESWVTKATCQELDSGGKLLIKKRDVGYVQDMRSLSYFGTSI
jgi:hypothetical protein